LPNAGIRHHEREQQSYHEVRKLHLDDLLPLESSCPREVGDHPNRFFPTFLAFTHRRFMSQDILIGV
jgi:hypothetical protein